MKKIVSLCLLLTFMYSCMALAQAIKYNYQFLKAFPDTGYKGPSAGHGVVVDPDGKVWIEKYGNSDSIKNAAGTYSACRTIQIFKPDGTPASFSPIKTITVGGVTDTLFGANVGLDKDNQGNILASVRASDLFKINYKTGAGMAKRHFTLPSGHSITKAACDTLGEIVIRSVFAGEMPVQIMDNTFADLGNAQDVTAGFSRTIAISKDGNDVFNCEYSGKYVLKLHSDNGTLGPYSKIDTLFNGKLAVESIALHPKTGYLWVSSGSNTNPSNTAGFSDFAWYAFTPADNYAAPVDSFKWQGSTANDPRPRGIAFTPTGDTVYVCQFNDSNSPIVEMFIKGATSVRPDPLAVATEYALGQNYPNPFNPSTSIKFSLPKASTITLKVYDVLGREVATLAEGRYEAGAYTATFDAKNLNSGVYFYTLHSSDGFVQTNKMMLMK